MKTLSSRVVLLVASGTALCLAGPLRAASPQATAPAPAPATNGVAFAEPAIPQSLFVVSANPREGRNPFFPNSTQGLELPKTNAPVVVDFKELVLNGITSPPKRTAMINGRTFEVGEEGEVRLPNGTKALIKCAQISDDSAVIFYSGQRRQLYLRNGL